MLADRHGPMTPVAIRDRRTLPFFQVRLRAVQEIRNCVSGPRRARTLGLYALLCQLANEQRATGEHLRLTATYADLTRRGGLGPNSLKVILGVLEDAGAARYEVRVDRLRGSLPSVIHLPVQDGPWIGITVDMAEHLAAQSEVRSLSALGLLVVLLEFCDEQREAHGGLVAETTRADIARRLGCSSDSLDTWVKALERVGVLTVTRRRGAGGAHLPNLWELKELADARPEQARPEGSQDDSGLADNENRPGPQREAPGRRSGRSLAENGKCPPEPAEVPGPQIDSGVAEEEKGPGGNTANPTSADRPFNGRGGDQPELSASENSLPPTPSAAIAEGGKADDQADVMLCQALLAVLEVTRGGGPARRYADDRDGWHAAARRVLVDHPADKTLEAIAYLEFDQIVGTKVRSMPDLERHIEDLRHRSHVARRQTTGSDCGATSTAPAWAAAFGHIKAAIRRHGAGGSAAARNELAELHEAYARFIDSVGWSSLCHDSPGRSEYEWKQAWKHASAAPDIPQATQEAA